MSLYYANATSAIFHGDTRDVLATEELPPFHTLLTDPPHWGAHHAQGVRAGIYEFSVKDEVEWHVGLMTFYRSWLPQMKVSIEANKGRAWIFLPPDNAPTFMRLTDILNWRLEHFWYAHDQYVLTHYGRNVPPADVDNISNAFHASRHPSQIDRAILDAILNTADGLVLDPFMGQGGTLAACQARGLKAIGIEQDATICASAKARLSGS